MQLGVRISSMALRLLWLINIVLGIYIAFIASNPGALVMIHMFTGILIVALLWFLGVAQGLSKKNGSLGLTLGTFFVGLALPIVGMAQTGATSAGLTYALQGLHVLLALGAIALGEISAARYRKGLVAAA